MNRQLAVVAVATVLCAAPAEAQTPTGNILRTTGSVTCAGSPCTGSAPNATTDGATLAQLRAMSIRLCADSGQTLSGAGTLDVYSMDEADSIWSIVPDLEITLDAKVNGKRCAVVLSDRETPLGTNRVAVVPNAVTLSGGNLTIIYARRTKALP